MSAKQRYFISSQSLRRFFASFECVEVRCRMGEQARLYAKLPHVVYSGIPAADDGCQARGEFNESQPRYFTNLALFLFLTNLRKLISAKSG